MYICTVQVIPSRKDLYDFIIVSSHPDGSSISQKINHAPIIKAPFFMGTPKSQVLCLSSMAWESAALLPATQPSLHRLGPLPCSYCRAFPGGGEFCPKPDRNLRENEDMNIVNSDKYTPLNMTLGSYDR